MRKTTLAFSVCLALCCVAAADDADEKSKDAQDLGKISVTSDSGKTQVDATKVNVRNAAMIKDIMRDIPGVYVGGTNGLNQKMYIRGINDRGLNITIDGARQKGNAFHHDADLYLDADIIKSVDVGLGVNSVVGNSGALGGSVAFKTVDASDLLEDGEVFGGKIKGGYASNNKEWQQSLSLYGRAFDSLDLLGYVGHRGYKRGKDGKGDDIGGKGDDTNYLFKVGYDFADYARISLGTEHFQTKGDYPLRAEWPSLGNLVDTKFIRDTYTANFTLNPNDFVDLDANAYYTDHRVESAVNAGVKTYGSKIINKTRFDTGAVNHTLVYGLEYYIAESYNKKAKNVPNDKAKSLSLFLEDQLRFGGFTLTPGLRYDRYELDTLGGAAGVAGRANYSWSEWSPALNLDYQFESGFGLYGSYAKVFRGPDPIESIRLSDSNVLNTVTNGDLKPETGDAYEAGARYEREFDDDQKLSLFAKYFYNDYDNLIIEMARAGRVEVQRQNGGRATVKGAEIAARYQIGNLGLGASYSRARTSYKDKKANSGYGGVLAYSDAGDKYTFNAEYMIAPIDTLIGYSLIAFSKIDTKNGSGTSYKKPGYAVSDLYATWAPDGGKYKGLELNFGVYNLFDKAYWSHSQRSAGSMSCPRGRRCPPTPLSPGLIDWEPGRNIKLSASYKF